MAYGTFETLRQKNAVLRGTVNLNSGIQLAAWYNNLDTITVQSDHHTLSLYIADGYESYQKTPHGWKNGGGPDRFCLMPKGDESTWDIRGDLSFVHLYCTDEHLRRVGEQIWDRSPASFTLQEKTFSSDDKITAVYRQFLLDNDWQQQANQLTLSSASTLLLTPPDSALFERSVAFTDGDRRAGAARLGAICWHGLRRTSTSRSLLPNWRRKRR
ncbi:transcriptional regulator [Klebsiella michiganensis]|nr:transcriptional regulator [Klebsiella michiganensis]